ncbi:MAG: succinate dehydrogenase assembly factor 2 [Desulfobacteraceae bacterium]|nr:succinate dehydrogenase assembly factor 2 [Desulfobacteraceae bacterium]
MVSETINTENRNSRLHWQCRRGMLELDTLLTTFLERGYDTLGKEGRQTFLELLDYDDTELLEYLMGRQSHMEVRIQNVIEAIRNSINC